MSRVLFELLSVYFNYEELLVYIDMCVQTLRNYFYNVCSLLVGLSKYQSSFLIRTLGPKWFSFFFRVWALNFFKLFWMCPFITDPCCLETTSWIASVYPSMSLRTIELIVNSYLFPFLSPNPQMRFILISFTKSKKQVQSKWAIKTPLFEKLRCVC